MNIHYQHNILLILVSLFFIKVAHFGRKLSEQNLNDITGKMQVFHHQVAVQQQNNYMADCTFHAWLEAIQEVYS